MSRKYWYHIRRRNNMVDEIKNQVNLSKVDYKKEYKDLYMPKGIPCVIDIPSISFVTVLGKGNPNEEDGEYQKAVELLYAISYTIKMSKNGENIPVGYFEYVVPPLEGQWWITNGTADTDYTKKSDFCWISMIRQPDFVTEEVFKWACKEVEKKKKLDTSKAEYVIFKEGLCVQCMHTGPFDNEPATIEKIEAYIKANGYTNDISETRHHHEIYLSDPRKCDVTKMKTVLRIPIQKNQ